MSKRRERFIIAQVGIMAGVILIIALFDEVGLQFWYVASYLGFTGLIVGMNILSIQTKSRRRILILLGLGGIGIAVLIVRATLQFI